MKKRLMVASAIAAVIGLAVGAVAGAGPLSESSTSVLPSASCGPVFYKGSGSPQYLIATDLPLTVGAGRAQTHGDAAGGAVRAREAVQLQGREVHGRLPGLRRLDCADRCVGPGEVLVERTRLRRGQAGPRGARDVQLRLRQAHRSDPQPGSGRSGCDAQLGEHERGTDAQRAVEQPRRAEDLLPDGREELRAGGGSRRLPGPGSRGSAPEQGLQVGPGQDVQADQDRLHRPRQPDVREGRRPGVPGQGQGPRHEGARLRAVGREGDELRGDRRADRIVGRAVRVPRRHRLQQRREAAQGPPRRCRAEGRVRRA